MPPELHEQIRCYSGHVPAVAVELLPRRPVVVTLLRHPVDRTISWLRHCQRHHAEHRDTALEAIYDDPWWNERFVADHQVKMLSMSLETALRPAWEGVLSPADGAFVEEVLAANHTSSDEDALRLIALF